MPKIKLNVCCQTCWQKDYGKVWFSPMIVCSICGNKRCPKATDHNLACTNSNEPGQEGSSY